MCNTEYASFAKENFLKREPRKAIRDKVEDPSQLLS